MSRPIPTLPPNLSVQFPGLPAASRPRNPAHTRTNSAPIEPDSATRPGKPVLRITTSFPPPQPIRPLALRHPALLPKTAPVRGGFQRSRRVARGKDRNQEDEGHATSPIPRGRCVLSGRDDETGGKTMRRGSVARRGNREVAVLGLRLGEGVKEGRRTSGTGNALEVQEVEENETSMRREHTLKGHRRRLSDRFKILIPFRKDQASPTKLSAPLSSEGEHGDESEHGDVSESHVTLTPFVIIPPRPYRSPGTASFVVSRHEPDFPRSASSLSPTPDSDGSASSCSTCRTSATARTTHTFGSRSTDQTVVVDATTHLAKSAYVVSPSNAVSQFLDPSTPGGAEMEDGASGSPAGGLTNGAVLIETKEVAERLNQAGVDEPVQDQRVATSGLLGLGRCRSAL